MKGGIYHLIVKLPRKKVIQVGRLGAFPFPKGFYVYTGSAQVSLGKRISRHLSQEKKLHWHIDYLRTYLHLKEIWYTYDCGHHEHLWATVLGCSKGATIPIPGFGASDCRCKSHLYLIRSKPSVRRFRDKLRAKLNGHGRIFTHKLK